MNKQFIGVVVLVVVSLIGVGIWYFSGDDSSTELSSETPASNQQQTVDSATSNQSEQATASDSSDKADVDRYTKEEVATHNTKNDCWTIISGKVYDITKYIPRHPGGSEIELACGTDGTSLFTSRTTQDGERVGSGTPHSSGASSQLQQFLVGELAQ